MWQNRKKTFYETFFSIRSATIIIHQSTHRLLLRFRAFSPPKNKTDRSLRFPGVFKKLYQSCLSSLFSSYHSAAAANHGLRGLLRSAIFAATAARSDFCCVPPNSPEIDRASAPATGSPPFSSRASAAHTAARPSPQGPASALRFNY